MGNTKTRIVLFAGKQITPQTVKECRELGKKIRNLKVTPTGVYTATWLPAALCTFFVLENLSEDCLEYSVPLFGTDSRLDICPGGETSYKQMLDLLDGISCAHPGETLLVCATESAIIHFIEAVTSGTMPFKFEDGRWLEVDVEGGHVMTVRYFGGHENTVITFEEEKVADIKTFPVPVELVRKKHSSPPSG